jgi:hypothetical protein
VGVDVQIGEERRTIFIEPIEMPAPAAEPSREPADDPTEAAPAEEPVLVPER